MTSINIPRTPGMTTERWFYSSMAVGIAAMAFAGFAPSFYLRSESFPGPPLTSLVYLHAFLATSWLLVTVLQTGLIATRRAALHRKVGWASLAIAASMILTGPFVGIGAVKRGAVPPGLPPEVFIVLPLAGITMFAGFVIAGILLRNRAQAHKRLMLLASISVLDAATARLPGMLAVGPMGFFAIADIFLVIGVSYDFYTRGRLHPAWLWGGAAIVISQPLRLIIATTPQWAAFVHMLTG